MHVTQIFISSEPNATVVEPLSSFCSHLQNIFSDHEYSLYNDEMIRNLISKNFSQDVLDAYVGFQPFAYKADLARYCILYLNGGLYVDLAIKWTLPMVVTPDIDLIIFRDRQDICQTSWAVFNGCFYATPKHPALLRAIDDVVINFKNKYYGKTSLCPTGPNAFGKAIASCSDNSRSMIGDFLELTPGHEKKNFALVLPDGTIAAYYKPGRRGDPGRLSSFSIPGTNDYNDFWFSRTVYGEKFRQM